METQLNILYFDLLTLILQFFRVDVTSDNLYSSQSIVFGRRTELLVTNRTYTKKLSLGILHFNYAKQFLCHTNPSKMWHTSDIWERQ
jgi:hypothetical protein